MTDCTICRCVFRFVVVFSVVLLCFLICIVFSVLLCFLICCCVLCCAVVFSDLLLCFLICHCVLHFRATVVNIRNSCKHGQATGTWFIVLLILTCFRTYFVMKYIFHFGTDELSFPYPWVLLASFQSQRDFSLIIYCACHVYIFGICMSLFCFNWILWRTGFNWSKMK